MSNPFELDPIALAQERSYAGTVVADVATLDSWPLTEGDLLHATLRQIVDAAREERRVRPRVTVPAIVKRVAHVHGPKAGDDASRILGDGLPYEPDLQPAVEAIRERGACRRAEGIARVVQQAAKRGAWHEVQRGSADLASVSSAGIPVDPIRRAVDVMRAAANPLKRDNASVIPIETTLDGVIKLAPGKWLTIGAPTNVAKTTLLRRWTRRAAINGHSSALITIEDPEDMIGGGWLAEESSVSSTKIRDGELDEAQRAMVSEALRRAEDLKLHVVQIRDRTLERVIAAMRALAAIGVRLIAIDYLQAIRGDMQLRTRKERIDHNLNELIACAATLNVAVILASQLVRPEKGRKAEPTLYDLKESGDIENCSTYVVIVWRDGEDSDAQVLGKVAKVKDGPGVGKRVAWDRDPDTGTLVVGTPPARKKRALSGGAFGA